MPAYLIGMMEITDPETYRLYAEGAGRALKPFEGRFRRLASTAATPPTIYEGEAPMPYMFIIEFESRETFESFYNSPAYREAIDFRHSATARGTVMVLEGL
jgi:uncharacterized protein (DUF1330 family)